MRFRGIILSVTVVLTIASFVVGADTVSENPADWRHEFPNTDFETRAIAYDEIVSDGAARDSIPPIDQPHFVPVAEATEIGPLEPVLGLVIGEDARAYPLRIFSGTRSSTMSSATCRS